MESKSLNQVMIHYLQEMWELYQRDVPPKIDAYCSVLKTLLYSSLAFLPGNVSKDKVVIDILEIPGELQIHMPRIRIWDGKAKVYGYIDVLKPVSKKKEIKSYPFLDLYKRLFPNLIITNFFEFLYYRGEQKVVTARPFSASNIGKLTDKTKVTSTRLFLKELQHFMDYRNKKSKSLEFIDLQQQLALKTYYLKEFILTPVLKHLICKGIKGELFRLYRAYCYFFNRELSIEEFSAFLSHLIIDGFLRAGIFYSAVNIKSAKPFSRGRVYKCAKFNRMSPRRLAVFKYLSQGPVEEQLPGAVQWFLDEICGFLANFNFKKMDIAGKNPMLIDGEQLQWEEYFFKPYYENDFKWVLELLKKAGIFTGGIKNVKKEKLSEPGKEEIRI
jgi:hypothetical protein